MQDQQYTEERGLLGSLCPGQKKLEGKTFYLDSVKKRPTALLLEAVSLLGGRVESFLHKDVSFVVTGSQEFLKEQKCTDSKAGAKRTSEEAKSPLMQRVSLLSSDRRRPGTPRPVACGSRGKALLEKAMRNNERLHVSSVLANARSWGVKILFVDDVLLYLKQLSRESFSATYKKPEKTSTKQGSHVVKAAALRSPYLKIEDLSRKYKPLHMQSMTFPTLCYSGRFSPFESPPPRFEKQTEQEENKKREKKQVKSSIQDKTQTPLSCNPSPWRPRKKDLSYCECCHQPFNNLEEHLQSDQHRAFVLDLSNYVVVDQLVAEMFPPFDPSPPQPEETVIRPPTPLPICDLETLTDAETEHAVQALQNQSSSFSILISSPSKAPLPAGPVSPSPGVQLPIPDLPATPLDIQPFIANTDCQLPDSHPPALSPAMPVSYLEQEDNNAASQEPDTQHLSPCPSPDPYSQPPVLSPQVPNPPPHYPYSDPPVLSPQKYTADEAVEGHTCEMETAESVSTSVFSSVAFMNEGLNGSSQECFFSFRELTCSTRGLECATLLLGRSCSLPQQTVTAPNPKKRSRSASPHHSRRKRKRITADFDYNGQSDKPESTILAKPEDRSLLDKLSCQIIQSCPNPEVSTTVSTPETLGSKQTFTMFCVPAVQTLTPAPNQMNILGHGGTSVAVQPSQQHSLKAKTCGPPLQFPNYKSHSALSSQDSQRSLSHSTSVCIESALIPDLDALSHSSSDSDWDCGLLSGLGQNSAAPLLPAEQNCELNQELLHMPCNWMHNTSYESRLHTVLQPSNPTTSLCGEDKDPSVFSRTVVPIVEVQH